MKFYSAVIVGSDRDAPPTPEFIEDVKRHLESALKKKGCDGIAELHGPDWQSVDESLWAWVMVAYGDAEAVPA